MINSVEFPVNDLFSIGYRSGPTLNDGLSITQPGTYEVKDPDLGSFLQMATDGQAQPLDLWYCSGPVSYARVFTEQEFFGGQDLQSATAASLVVNDDMTGHLTINPEPSSFLLCLVMAVVCLFTRRR